MQIGTKFSVAIHILLCVEVFSDQFKVTSDFIASSVGTNPVVIRKLMGLLKEAGLIEIAAGTGGTQLTRSASKITLLDIFRAIEPVKDGHLFRMHEESAPACPVGGNITTLLDGYFSDAQNALERQLSKSSLRDLLSDLDRLRANA
jgi:Predicted transcriptional regulator